MSLKDIVIGGPDMSGTSTQIKGLIRFFREQGKIVRDIRGDEISAIFHAKIFEQYNSKCYSITDFMNESSEDEQKEFIFAAERIMLGAGGTNEDLQVASMVKNECSTFIDPDSADVWIMEEPTKRGAGQVNRTIEQQRSQYGSSLDPNQAAYCHSTYRIDEFLRFRGVLRSKNKIIIRSRSEESACYQIEDPKFLKRGISEEDYLNLPGHKVAFSNAPTHIFIVCGPKDWSKETWLKLKDERSGNRSIDDYESNVDYQLLVNRRYASTWINNLYEKGCALHGGVVPKFVKLDIYDSIEEIDVKIQSEFK